MKKLRGLWVALLAMLSIYTVQAAPSWKVNLKDADISALVAEVAEITGKNFVVDPRVKGTVTVISTQSLNKDQVYDLFLGVLDVNGFSAVPMGNVIKIVPDINARTGGVKVDMTGGQSQGEELVTRVVLLDSTNAVDLVPVLRPMMPQFAHLAAVPDANALILSDRASNIASLIDVIHALDSVGSEPVTAIDLKYAQVADVVTMLKALTPISTPKDAKTFSRLHVVEDERTNRLIVRGDAQAVDHLRQLVTTLDLPAINTGNIEVFRLAHASAKEVAGVLNKMVGSSSGTAAAAPGAAKESAAKFEGPATIEPDKEQNAVVVRADPRVMREIEHVIKELDTRRAEVLIQAAIVEITGSNGNQLGIQWAGGDPATGIGTISFSNAGTSLNSAIEGYLSTYGASSAYGSTYGSNMAGGGYATASPMASGASGVTLSDGATVGFGREIHRANGQSTFYGALVEALATASNANLLSAPSVLTLDNQEAKIVVGENVPFITGASTSAVSGTNNPFQTIERKDVGITLKVVPHISDGKLVRLEVDQEVSAVLPEVTGVHAADLITSTRNIKTTVLVNNHQTIVLGGLMQNDTTNSESKVPLLGDIPFLGWLFKASGDNVTKTNLLIFLTPTIVVDGEAIDTLTHKSYQDIRTFQMGLWGDKLGVLPDDIQKVYQGVTKPDKATKSSTLKP
ncbi:MAG: type II secretion system secretin GspD [Pseudomonadales bacterium]|nr:type II secretion system secretin GspD [Pseudomonadales bacterium]